MNTAVLNAEKNQILIRKVESVSKDPLILCVTVKEQDCFLPKEHCRQRAGD